MISSISSSDISWQKLQAERNARKAEDEARQLSRAAEQAKQVAQSQNDVATQLEQNKNIANNKASDARRAVFNIDVSQQVSSTSKTFSYDLPKKQLDMLKSSFYNPTTSNSARLSVFA